MSYANMDGVPTQTEGVSEILASDWNTYVRDNFDSIKFGHLIATEASPSDTRPSGVAEGTMVYTTDTERLWVYSSGDWHVVANPVVGTGVSVVGRSANSSGDRADIVASADGQVLRRASGVVGFGSIATAGIGDNQVTDAKLRDSAGLSVIGNASNVSDSPADIVGSADQVLRVSGSTLGFGTITSAMIEDGTITFADLAAALQELLNPVGTVQPWAGASSTPSGWFVCDGSEKAIASYTALYNVLTNSGTTFPYGTNTNGSGGVGTSHFRIPDLRGRVIAGIDFNNSDNNRLFTTNNNAATLGSVIGDRRLATHSHADTINFVDTGHVHGLNMHSTAYSGGASANAAFGAGGSPTNPDFGGGGGGPITSRSANLSKSGGVTDNTDGGTQGNVQPTMMLKYIIKA